jgi:multiple sugar transport system permease protein
VTQALSMRRRESMSAGLLMAPSLALILGLLLVPMGYSLAISLFDLHATAPWLGVSFVGLGNFAKAFSSPDFAAAIGRTLYLAAIGIGLGIPISVAFALILNRPFKGRGLVRGLLIIPWVIPGSVQGLLWSRIFDPHYGALNGLLYQLGIIDSYKPWLIDPALALFMVALANLWASVPMLTLLYLAGLQGIPKDLYEAANVDGSSRARSFWRITFPLLLPVTLIALILKTIDAFSLFDLVYILTGGGPADSTQVTGYYLYQAAFTSLDYGYASALAWIIAIATGGLALLYSKITRAEEVSQ